MATVSLENVRKTYRGGVDAVRDVSLEIADGEFVVFVGPAGCGEVRGRHIECNPVDRTG